jgi:hypothetical protein
MTVAKLTKSVDRSVPLGGCEEKAKGLYDVARSRQLQTKADFTVSSSYMKKNPFFACER